MIPLVIILLFRFITCKMHISTCLWMSEIMKTSAICWIESHITVKSENGAGNWMRKRREGITYFSFIPVDCPLTPPLQVIYPLYIFPHVTLLHWILKAKDRAKENAWLPTSLISSFSHYAFSWPCVPLVIFIPVGYDDLTIRSSHPHFWTSICHSARTMNMCINKTNAWYYEGLIDIIKQAHS